MVINFRVDKLQIRSRLCGAEKVLPLPGIELRPYNKPVLYVCHSGPEKNEKIRQVMKLEHVNRHSM
jgi:hypothetical protein